MACMQLLSAAFGANFKPISQEFSCCL